MVDKNAEEWLQNHTGEVDHENNLYKRENMR